MTDATETTATEATEVEAERTRRDRRDVIRLVAAGVVIVSFVALAVIAIAASRSDLRLTAPPASQQRTAPPERDTISLITSSPAPPLAAPAAPTVPPAVPASPATVPVTEPPTLPPPPALPSEDTGKPCAAFGLPAPQQVGGLQSLIRLVPLFGPFSAEAFAMMPAFEPGFDVLGPLFPVFELGLDSLAPVLDVITPPAQQLTQALFDLIAPGYAPYRDQFLSAEAQLAAYLQPIMQSLADAPGSECLVALEGLLASLVL